MSAVIEEITDEPSVFSDPKWADVVPEFIPNDKNLCIQYAPDHKLALSYFQALLKADERSERMRELCKIMINFNMADYTAWEYLWRSMTFLGIEKYLDEELEVTEQFLDDNAKNYQLWNFRRKLALYRIYLQDKLLPAAPGKDNIKTLSDGLNEEKKINENENELRRLEMLLFEEFAYAYRALVSDEKHYHVWAHRQAILLAVDRAAAVTTSLPAMARAWRESIWRQELEFTGTMITRDVRNNSAWNQRNFVLLHLVKLLPGAETEKGEGKEQGVGEGGRQDFQGEEKEAVGEKEAVDEEMIEEGMIEEKMIEDEVAETSLKKKKRKKRSGEEKRRESKMMVLKLREELLRNEFWYSCDQIRKAPHNESSWAYLQSLFTVVPWNRSFELARHSEIHEFCSEILASHGSVPYAVEVLAQYYLAVAASKATAVRDAITATASSAHVMRSNDAVANTSDPTSLIKSTNTNTISHQTLTLTFRPSTQAKATWLRLLEQSREAAKQVHRLLLDLCTCDPIRSALWIQRREEIERLSYKTTVLSQLVETS